MSWLTTFSYPCGSSQAPGDCKRVADERTAPWLWFAVLGAGWLFWKRAQEESPAQASGANYGGFGCTDHRKLLPVSSPKHNMREVCKQLVLLEDHLTHRAKSCPDCIRKHFLTVEALLEEALGLDSKQEFRSEIEPAITIVRATQRQWVKGVPPARIAQNLRALRKRWSASVFNASM